MVSVIGVLHRGAMNRLHRTSIAPPVRTRRPAGGACLHAPGTLGRLMSASEQTGRLVGRSCLALPVPRLDDTAAANAETESGSRASRIAPEASQPAGRLELNDDPEVPGDPDEENGEGASDQGNLVTVPEGSVRPGQLASCRSHHVGAGSRQLAAARVDSVDGGTRVPGDGRSGFRSSCD